MVISTRAVTCAAIVLLGLVYATRTSAAQETPQAPRATDTSIRQIFDVRTPMRDGVQLSSDVWLPSAPGRYPIILVRTPYVKSNSEYPPYGKYFAAHGYAFAVQDVRGRGDSNGEFDFFFREAADGYDTVEGLAKEPWSDGRICMLGVSYMATVQWLAAKERPPHLVCIAPTSPGMRFVNELPYLGGAFALQWALPWLNGTAAHNNQNANAASVDWMEVLRHRPLTTADVALGRPMRLYQEFLQHDTLDQYWKRIYLQDADFARIDVPILAVTGLFDADQWGALFSWQGVEKNASGSAARRYLILGPWTHAQSYDGGSLRLGELEFSKDSVIDNKAVELAFFDRYLRQLPGLPDLPRVQVYVTGLNRWRRFETYPVAADTQRFFLASSGKANTLNGDGVLSRNSPRRRGPFDSYVYDPTDPIVMTFPGAFWGADRRKTQARQDVLVYTSAQLKSPLQIIGPVFLELYAASDARDTDFTASLSDVYPDGRAISLGPLPFGILRARYRHGFEKTELLSPGKPDLFRIELGHVAHEFLAGHRIRVEVSSSAAPLINPNQNTGNPVATDTEWRRATQTVFHDRRLPSALILPVVKSE